MKGKSRGMWVMVLAGMLMFLISLVPEMQAGPEDQRYRVIYGRAISAVSDNDTLYAAPGTVVYARTVLDGQTPDLIYSGVVEEEGRYEIHIPKENAQYMYYVGYVPSRTQGNGPCRPIPYCHIDIFPNRAF